jgi:hypothetical protein
MNDVQHKIPTVQATMEDMFFKLGGSPDDSDEEKQQERALFASTVFGPTCDSIDVISRSALLPRLSIGDWMYFQNMGAYTMAAARAPSMALLQARSSTYAVYCSNASRELSRGQQKRKRSTRNPQKRKNQRFECFRRFH